MLLTLKQSSIHEGFKGFHDYSHPAPPSPLRYSLAVTSASLPPLSATTSPTDSMATPHRGLPPPAGMTLPTPPPPGPPPLPQPMQLPNPPSQWQGDSMRNWLQAKTEDDRRRQEEEKTRQETIRLEVRRVEHSMLRESIQGGVPPYMIPMVFAGISGGNLANMSIEWAQHYVGQVQQQQQQVQAISQGQMSPELRREPRMIGQQPQFGTPQSMTTGNVTPQAAPPPPGAQSQPTTFLPPYQISPSSRAASKQAPGPAPPTSYPRPGPPPHSSLPRLNTGELQIQPPPQPLTSVQIPHSGSGQPMPPLQGSGSSQHTPNMQEQPTTSPSIYFHHWVPPNSQSSASANPPTTPSATKSTDSQFPAAKRASQFGDPDFTNSPKKRKGQSGQPTSVPTTNSTQPQQYSSPQFSQSATSTSGARRSGHSRNRSDSSARGHDSYGRPTSRHRRSEGGAGSQGESVGSSRGGYGGTASTGGQEDNGSGGGSHQHSPLQHETRPDDGRD